MTLLSTPAAPASGPTAAAVIGSRLVKASVDSAPGFERTEPALMRQLAESPEPVRVTPPDARQEMGWLANLLPAPEEAQHLAGLTASGLTAEPSRIAADAADLGEDKADFLTLQSTTTPSPEPRPGCAHSCCAVEGPQVLPTEVAALLNRAPTRENPGDLMVGYDEIPSVAAKTMKSGPVGNTSITRTSGALSNIVVYATAGHGYVWENSAWRTQRGITNGMVEDMGNLEQYNFFVNYAFNAGATVVPIRPVGYQRNEVVLDNDSTAVAWSGTWANSSSTIFYGSAGDVAYRWTNAAASQSAFVRYTPSIPAAGYYPVYTWALNGSDRVNQLYRIRHSGGTAEVRVNHKRVGMGWVWLGTYYFESGSGGYVEISNQSSETPSFP